MLPEGGGVVDFLEVILSDFARLESETSASEAAEQDAYDQFMFESKKDKAGGSPGGQSTAAGPSVGLRPSGSMPVTSHSFC